MGSLLRVTLLALVCVACSVATARATDPYAGFGDPVAVGPSAAAPVRAAAPLPGGAAALLAGAPTVGALDTRTPNRIHWLGAAWDAALVTWPDGGTMAAWTGADGLHLARAAADGTWGTAHAAGGGLPSQAVAAVARPGGDAVVAWTDHAAADAPGEDRAHAVLVAADGTPGPVQDLGAATTIIGVPALAEGADGTVALADPEPTGAGGHPGALSVSLLAPGAAAFGASQSLDGLGGGPPAVAVTPDGTTLATGGGGRVVRLAPDGHVVSDLPLSRAGYAAGLGVAPGGTTAVLSSNGAAWDWSALASDGSPLPAGPPASALEVAGVPEVHVWDDGSATAFIRTTVGDSDEGYAAFVARNAAGATSSTTLALGPAVAGFPGAAPGSFTAFAADRGRLWRVTRPGAPARRPATLTLARGLLRPGERTASFHLAADEAGSATVHVRVRHGGGRWRTISPVGGDAVALLPLNGATVRLPLPGSGSPCTGGRGWTVAVAARFRNRAGVPAAARLTYASGCSRVRRTAR